VQSLQNGTPAHVQKHQHNTEVFNLLGYEVVIPKATEVYVSIRNEFQQLAKEARDRMTRNFRLIDYARYFKMPIDELIQDLNADVENRERLAQLFGESVVELEHKLQNNSLFNAIRTQLSEDPIRASEGFICTYSSRGTYPLVR
jgi:gamma-glutamyl:cysteine ligase YbdK (ATP-grasp superfamily)